jgi:DNA-binding response OmpR family regulator
MLQCLLAEESINQGIVLAGRDVKLMAKILIAEDDAETAFAVKQALAALQHVVEIVSDGSEASFRLATYNYDLAILDWGLPELSGLAVCQKYRASGGKIPILMMTGKADIVEKEAGLDSGADDYLTKPFNFRELTARIRALLRRSPELTGNVLQLRDLVLDTRSCRVWRGGEEISLWSKEFALLEYLMRKKNQVVDVNDLLENVWSSESESSEDAVRQCIARLRRKIDREGERPLISTIKGLGYRLDT